MRAPRSRCHSIIILIGILIVVVGIVGGGVPIIVVIGIRVVVYIVSM